MVYRERSRSRDREDRSRHQNEDKPKRRKRRVGWGDPTDVVLHGADSTEQKLILQQQQVLALQQQMGNKKAREVYCGNLAAGQVTMASLREHFNQMFYALPEFNQKYEFLKSTGAGCIQDLKLATDGTYSFIQFFTEEIAVTALEFDKHEFLGRALRIGRPTGVVLTTPPPPPMDVSSLRALGYLPAKLSSSTADQAVKKQREVYVGNLHPGVMTHDLIQELFEPACKLLPDFTESDRTPSPIASIEFGNDGRFAFVEFINESIASAALLIFNQVELLGKRMSVMRPQGYIPPSSAV
jgi:RNA recognition motif-containing protein